MRKSINKAKLLKKEKNKRQKAYQKLLEKKKKEEEKRRKREEKELLKRKKLSFKEWKKRELLIIKTKIKLVRIIFKHLRRLIRKKNLEVIIDWLMQIVQIRYNVYLLKYKTKMEDWYEFENKMYIWYHIIESYPDTIKEVLPTYKRYIENIVYQEFVNACKEFFWKADKAQIEKVLNSKINKNTTFKWVLIKISNIIHLKTVTSAIAFFRWIQQIFNNTFEKKWIYYHFKNPEDLYNQLIMKLFKEYKISTADRYYRNSIAKNLINEFRTRIFWLSPLSYWQWINVNWVEFTTENKDIDWISNQEDNNLEKDSAIDKDIEPDAEIQQTDQQENQNKQQEYDENNPPIMTPNQQKMLSSMKRIEEFKQKWSLFHSILASLEIEKMNIRNKKVEDFLNQPQAPRTHRTSKTPQIPQK